MIDKSLFNNGEKIAVALSGGKDSMCLLSLLLENRKQLNIEVCAVHVDHSIRGIDSENDASFVKNYCEKLDVPIKIYKVDAPLYCKQNGLSLEQGARLLRYGIFNELLACGYCDKVATAHHKNDNFESLLFNLFRGTGLKGAGGIPRQNGKIIRPLLDVARKQIDNYVKSNNLPFTQDKTNLQDDYSRNYIRNNLVPLIEERFPEAVQAGARFSLIAKEEDEFLDKLSSQIIEEKNGEFYIPLDKDDVLIKRATIIALNRLGLEKDYEFIHAEQVLSLKNLQSGAMITLPKGYVAVKEYGFAVLKKGDNQKDLAEHPFSVGTFEFDGALAEVSIDNGSHKFDGDKIPDNAVIRTRREGDVFKKFGSGTKKLKEFLIDKKIPLSQRDKLPVIAKDNVVYLVFGVEISDDIKITSDTKTILYANLKAND